MQFMLSPHRRPARSVSVLLFLLASACGDEHAAMAVAAGAEGGAAGFGARLAEFVASSSAQPERAALLVGVGDYAASGLPDLAGCRNDVQRMSEVLEQRFGFRDQDVFVLLDREATHEHIVRAFEAVLLRRAGPATEAFLFLAGHGSRVPDRSGAAVAEPDAFDSTFLAYDSRQQGRRGERDLTDDELRSLVAALVRKTPRVTVVTDACHSGGALRGGEPRAVPDAGAALDEAWLRSFWPAQASLEEDAAGVQLDERSYVHVAASRRDRAARELRVGAPGQERSFGALTYCLAGALELARPGTTWREVTDEVAARVRLEAHQSVQVEGALDRELFGGEFRSAFGHRAQRLADPELLEVAAGFLFGLRRGSVLEVWDVRGETLHGTATVEELRVDAALARWDTLPEAAAGPALRVREVSRGVAEPPLRIALEERSLGLLLEGSNRIELGSSDPDAPYRLRPAEAGRALFETREGVQLASVGVGNDDLDSARQALSTAIDEESTFLALRELALERGELELSIDFRPAIESELRGLGLALERHEPVRVLDRDSARTVSVHGAAASAAKRQVGLFEITNHSDVRVHVYVLSLEESRHRELIRTLQGELSLVLEPGERATHPVAIVAPASWTSPVPMLDRYVALAFTEALSEPRRLEARERTRGLEDRLPGVLQRIVAPGALRGAGAAKLDRQGWGVAYVDLLVRP
jgi:hypothetical protein